MQHLNRRMKEEFLSKERGGGELHVLRSLKIIRTIITNGIILAAIYLLLANGASPDIVSILGLGGFLLYNGVELAEVSALLGAISEVTAAAAEGNDSDDD